MDRVKTRKSKARFILHAKLQETVIPHFLHFKVANCRLQNSTVYRQCQWKFLQEEVDLKQLHIRILSSQSNAASLCLSSLVSSLDLIHLKTLSDHENIRSLNCHQKIYDRKLFCLCSRLKTTDSLNPDNVMFNFFPVPFNQWRERHSKQRTELLITTWPSRSLWNVLLMPE